jgi:hypothetical protein
LKKAMGALIGASCQSCAINKTLSPEKAKLLKDSKGLGSKDSIDMLKNYKEL